MIWFEKRVGSLGGKEVPSGEERRWRRLEVRMSKSTKGDGAWSRLIFRLR